MEADFRIKTLLGYLQDDPEDAFSKYALALEYIKAGADSEAFRWMQDLLNNHPEYLPNYYHFGKLLERMGELSNAVAVYEKGMMKAKEQQDMHTFNELSGSKEEIE